MQVKPSSGIGGVEVQILGSGYPPNLPVEFSYYDPIQKIWNYWETQTANASGVFVFNKEIPDLGASLSSGDNAETTKSLSFKAYGNGTLAFADYYQYLRGLKTVDDQTATGLFGNNTYLSQVQVKVGENVSILGKYFHPQDTIYIRWDDIQEVGTVTGEQWLNAQIVGTSLTSTTGSFDAQFTVPLCSIGAHYIAIQDSQTKLIVQIYVMNSTTLNISPYSGPGGIPVNLFGMIFPAGSNVDIKYLDQSNYADSWNYLTTVTANQAGQIFYSFNIPDLGEISW